MTEVSANVLMDKCMRNAADRNKIGGEAIHIGDCYVWAEIYYLDSPTDYREHLPNHVQHQSGAPGDEFVTLDNIGSFSPRSMASLLVILLAIAFTLYYLCG